MRNPITLSLTAGAVALGVRPARRRQRRRYEHGAAIPAAAASAICAAAARAGLLRAAARRLLRLCRSGLLRGAVLLRPRLLARLRPALRLWLRARALAAVSYVIASECRVGK